MVWRLLAIGVWLSGTGALAGSPASDPEAPPQVSPEPAPEANELELFAREEEIKTVVSASQQAEPLQETPGPVTVITAEMIRAIGAQTLEQVLDTYVPGFTLVQDHNERILAMRGVYASAQQQILVMVDGHRINSRAYSEADPDHTIGLEEVKQIEVLRGPASAIYGNVALTAVVNLVTKKGADVNGARAEVGLGNYGQRTAGLLLGAGLEDKGDFLAWAHYYEASGQSIAIDPAHCDCAIPKAGTALVGGVFDPPAYDVGAKYRLGNLSAYAQFRGGKSQVEPFTSGGATGEVYDITKLRRLTGTGPGITHDFSHFELKYARPVADVFDVEATAYYDTSVMGSMLVTSGDTNSATFLSWKENDFGAVLLGRAHYNLNRLGSGNATLGFQLDRMTLIDSSNPAEVNGNWSKFGDSSTRPLLQPGHEVVYSVFGQLKHRVSDFVFNAGLRYDEKQRHVEPDLAEVSPRVAVIYAPATSWDLKLSYGKSFVDAPYWYRYNSLPSYQGSQGLTPQHLQAVQLTGTVHLGDHLTESVNVFYDDLYNFVFRDNAGCTQSPPVCYRNAGSLKSVGAEEELAYTQRVWRLRVNATYQRALAQSSVYVAQVTGPEIPNVPSFVGNAILDVSPLAFWTDKVRLNGTLQYIGPQLAPITAIFKSSTGTVLQDYTNLDNRIGGHALVNAGVHLTDVGLPGVLVDGTVYNLFDQQYLQGGSPTHPYPQPGRWFLVTLGYTLPANL